MENKLERVDIRDARTVAAEINAIKDQTRRIMLTASAEIGKLLCEAKELVPHGRWGDWLEENVEYSISTANNLMRIYREFGDNQIDLFSGKAKSQAFENLTYTQAVALFGLPEEERAAFVKEHDLEKMSSRELEEAIKARKQAEQEMERAKNRYDGAAKLLEKEKKEREAAQNRAEELEKQIRSIRESAEETLQMETEKLRLELIAAQGPSEEELKKARAEILAEVENKYKEQEKQLTFEKQSAEKKKAAMEEEYKKELERLKLDNASLQKSREEAEKKLQTECPEINRCTVYFEEFQRAFNSMIICIQKTEESGAEKSAQKLRQAIRTVAQNQLDQL